MPDWLQRTLAAVALVASAPVLALIAVVVRRDSPGPILYGAARIGRNGLPFTAWKFRTMSTNRPNEGPAISTADDARVTRVGRRLRRMRLDELPQLWNVLRGEMRLVGPRPEDPRFVDLSDGRQLVVIGVRPGITGLAQLVFADEARVLGSTNPEDAYRSIVRPRKLQVDAAYVRHRSFALDIEIIVTTVLILAGRQPPFGRIDRLVGSSDWRLPR